MVKFFFNVGQLGVELIVLPLFRFVELFIPPPRLLATYCYSYYCSFMLFHCKIYETIKRLFLIPMIEPEAELVHVPLHYFTDTL